MRTIDIQTWPRREHFEFFNAYNHPHFNMCANVDLTTFYPAVKKHGESFTAALVYVIARASNAIPEFRYRIRDEVVVEHEDVHPAGTIQVDKDLFNFCVFGYVEDFSVFADIATEKIESVKANPSLKVEYEVDELVFMTAIPWVSFTSFMHPMQFHPTDSVPRYAWGKTFEEGEFLKMPLSVQGHHALMDGIHVAKFYTGVQNYFDHPGAFLGNI